MKYFSYFGFFIFATLFCTCIFSCSEEYSSPLKGQTVSNQIFETGTTTKTITIGKGDLSKCTIVSNADWCSASIQGSSVTISVKANDTYDERQATITLTDPEDATTLSFIVVQNQNDAIFVDNNTFNVPEEGGIVKIKIESNVDYDVELPVEGWITIQNGTRGLKKSELSLNIALNNSGNTREGIVKVINKTTGIHESILIKQALTPRVEIDPNYISVDEHGDDISVKVKSNVRIANITTNESWITIGDMKSIDGFNFSVIIKILPMTNLTERSGLVAFESSNGSFLSLLSVDQMLNEILSVDKTSISADYKGGDFYLTVTTNAGYTMTNTSWILMSRLSYDELNYGTINKIPYKFTIRPNDSEKERNGTIKIKGKTKEVTVIVNQSGKPKNSYPSDISELVSCYIIVDYPYDFCRITAYLVNNSPYTIYLSSAYLDHSGDMIGRWKLNNSPLGPGESFWVQYEEGEPTHGKNIDENRLSCLWSFFYNGKEYPVIGYKK